MEAWRVIKACNISFIRNGYDIEFYLHIGDIIFTDICGQTTVKLVKYPYRESIIDVHRLCKIIHYEDNETQIYENVNFISPTINKQSLQKTIGVFIEKSIEWEREEKLKKFYKNI